MDFSHTEHVEDAFIGNPFDATYLIDDPQSSILAEIARSKPKKKNAAAKLLSHINKMPVLEAPYIFAKVDFENTSNLILVETAEEKARNAAEKGRSIKSLASLTLAGISDLSPDISDAPKTRPHYSPTVKTHNNITHLERFRIERVVGEWQIMGGLCSTIEGYQLRGIRKIPPSFV